MNVVSKKKAYWVTWEIQPRNRSMSQLLGIELFEIIINKPRMIKYPFLIWRTLGLIIKNRPDVLIVQNPSIVLAFVASIFKNIFSYKLIMDAHNAGIYPLEGRNKFLNNIARLICQRVDVTIVTNQQLARQVEAWEGRAFVMPDPLPRYSISKTPSVDKSCKVFLLICTWAADEPYLEIIKAAESLGDQIQLRITGNYRKKLSQSNIDSLQKNIHLLGYISEEKYLLELSAADFTIDLTTREHCLVCGAYESVAMGVPGIISDTEVNRDVFSKGFIFSGNDVDSIRRAIITAVKASSLYQSEIIEMKVLHNKKMESLKEKINDCVFS